MLEKAQYIAVIGMLALLFGALILSGIIFYKYWREKREKKEEELL